MGYHSTTRYNFIGQYICSNLAANYPGEPRQSQLVNFAASFLQMHSYIIGQSGTGKSTLLQHIALGIEGGFCLLDPHGDLAEAVADSLDCIYFDPAVVPIGLNVLKNVAPHKRHLVAAHVIAAFKAVWGLDDATTPRLLWLLYTSVRLLLDNNASVLDIPQLLTDGGYRRRCVRRLQARIIKDPTDAASASLYQHWQHFDDIDERERNKDIAPVLNKVGQLAADPTLQKVLGANNCLPLTKLMNTGRRLVVNLSKSKLGDSPSHLLGALLVSALYQAAQVSQRQPFTLIADEFQNFATDTFATILSEARKYGINLILCHQLLAQISEPLRAAVFGNVHSITSFRISPEDAHVVAPALGLANPEVLSDLPNFEYWKNSVHPPRPIHATPGRAPQGCDILARNIRRAGTWYA